MISKSWLKLLKSLQLKKYRTEEGSFLVEGAKSVLELLKADFQIKKLFVTEKFLADHSKDFKHFEKDIVITSDTELNTAGTFSTNNAAIAVAGIKENKIIYAGEKEYAIVLDDIKDPGNLGTIIRIADWYGINKIICSNDTVEFYNPKVISSTMGSFTRVKVFYGSLMEYFGDMKSKPRILGAFLEGADIHTFKFPEGGYIVMGNESSGIRPALKELIQDKISIPGYGKAESLNVAVATAVICDNLRRGRG